VPKRDHAFARWGAVAVIALVAAAALAAIAEAERTTVQSGSVEITFGADFSPRKLSGAERAPVAFTVGGTIASTGISNPPPLRELTLGLGRNGSIDGTTLPRCEEKGPSIGRSLGELEEACGNAIVGAGRIGLGIIFPGEKAIPAAARMVIFNGKGKGGGTTLYAYAEITQPIVTTVVIPIEIRGRSRGGVGTQMILTVPRIAGDYGFISEFRMTLRRRIGNGTAGVAAFRCPGEEVPVKVRAIFSEGPPVRTELPIACQQKAKLAK
jgi:hypothetical protein